MKTMILSMWNKDLICLLLVRETSYVSSHVKSKGRQSWKDDSVVKPGCSFTDLGLSLSTHMVDHKSVTLVSGDLMSSPCFCEDKAYMQIKHHRHIKKKSRQTNTMTTLKLEGKGDMIQIHCIIVWNSLPVALIHPKKTMILCQITVSKLNTTTNKTVKVTSNQTTHSCLKKKQQQQNIAWESKTKKVQW